MAIKVDLYSAREGREASAGTSAGKGGRGGGKFAGQNRKLGNVEEGTQPDSVAMVADKKKLQELKKKSYAEAKKLKKMQKANRQARPKICNFLQEGGAFLSGLPRDGEVAKNQCKLFGKRLGCVYTPYREDQQLQLSRGRIG